MSRSLAVIGAGGHAMVVADTAQLLQRWDRITHFDDMVKTEVHHKLKIAGTLSELIHSLNEFSEVFVAIGDNAVRQTIQSNFQARGAAMASLVHPSAFVNKDANIGDGTIILPQAVVMVGSDVGRGCILNTSSSIDHECKIGDFVHVSPGSHIGGNVQVGIGTWVGIGASVRHGIQIGSNTVIGAGSTVVKDIPDNSLAFGVPAIIQTQANFEIQ